MTPELANRLRSLPDQPGVYVFKSALDESLYVGKAKSLRKRVVSYLKTPGDSRLQAMLEEAVDLDFLLTGSEADALAVENSWIKQRQPRYNVRLRDDKTYPYLQLTLGDEYPRLAFTRRVRQDASEYYGPYLPAGLARRAIKLAQKLFQVRVCRIPIDGGLARPCLYYDMKRCLGPCVRGLTDEPTYRRAVERARLFLSGKSEELISELRAEMLARSATEEFEQAALLRNLIVEIESVARRRTLASEQFEDVDVYGVHVAEGHAAVVVLVLRNGQVLDRRELFWEGSGDVSDQRLLDELLPQIYDRTTFIPREIHLPAPIEGEESLLEWLSERRGSRVQVRLPARGSKAKRVALAMQNAKLAHRRRFRGGEQEVHVGAAALARHLGLAEAPARVEGFDISTFQGSDTVASLVVWARGKMVKGEYRSFNIRSISGQDDFASMREAVERRYRRRLAEAEAMPDLILIDGGRGQLNAALEGLAALGVEETPIVGLAKREEELYLPAAPEPLRLPRADAGLQLLQTIRDEAHRFAVGRHRQRRSAGALRSGFDALQGVGEQRRKLLVRRFGSFRGVKAATREDLTGVLGERLGARVHAQLHPLEVGGQVEG
jgi:excinuclease ABC subunit C